MTRHIFIGDIHGCFDELTDLLSALDVSDSDVVVSLGDMVRKGPSPDRCLDLWRERRYLAVLGNNDRKILLRSRRWLPSLLAAPADRAVLRRRDLIQMMSGFPLFLDFPRVGVVAVHGGVLPNSDRFGPELVPSAAALELRFIRRGETGRWEPIAKGQQQPGDPFWSSEWNGDRTVVYGHTPVAEPRIDKRAIGIDTGCVYGGKLTAAVFETDGTWSLIAVPVRCRYSR